MKKRALTMLNESGDTTIVWDEAQDDEMRAIIEQKMKEGVTFFIIEPRAFGFLPPKKSALGSVDEAMKHRALSIPDNQLRKFVESGRGEAVKTPPETVKSVRKARSAEEVASSQSVGVKPMRGG